MEGMAGDDLEPIAIASDDRVQLPRTRAFRATAMALAAIATASLGVAALSTVQLVRQGERRECVERANARAGLEVFGEPDGRSSQRIAANRYAACFGLADSSETEETVSTTPVRECPGTRHPFEDPPLPDESGDGLPMSGTVTRRAAERIAANRPAASRPRVVAVKGRAWTRDEDRRVLIKEEELYVVDLLVRDLNDCPRAPVMDGVPLRFFYPID
jgi:hypothetical protein